MESELNLTHILRLSSSRFNGVSAKQRTSKVQSFSCVDFSAVDGTAYMHTDCNEIWPSYSWMYNLQNSIQFETISTSNTKKNNLKHGNCLSIYIAVLHAVGVLIVTSQEFLLREQCVNVIIIWNLYSNVPMNTKILGYMFIKLKTMFSDIIFTVPLTLSFWLSFYKTIKYLNSCNMFSKNKIKT